MLDPYVLLTFKGTQQRGALPAQGRGSQKLLGMLDPREEPCQPRREAPRSCWGCWILTSSLFLKEFRREKPCQPRGEAPRSCRGCWTQKLLGMLDPYVLLTFKGTSRKEPGQPRTRAPRSCWGCWILTSSLLLKELSREVTGQPRREAPTSSWACWILTSSLLLKELNREEPCQPRGEAPRSCWGCSIPERSLASPGERLPEAAGGAGSLRPPYF